jgi:polysaccharide biosynthesis/export protein
MDSGDLNAPHVGPIRAAGRTCRDVAYQVKRKLEESVFVKATVILVLNRVDERNRGNIDPTRGLTTKAVDTYTVFGFVIRQGPYELPWDQDVSITQALLRAGGPAQFANLKKVRVLRKLPSGQTKTIQVDVKSIMSLGRMDRDIYIRTGDVIVVPEQRASF